MTRRSANLLTVVPMGGLGNRMRVVRSAYAFALEGECEVEVAFAANHECGCNFSDVFQPISLPSGNFSIREARWADAPPSRENLHLPQMVRTLRGTKQFCNLRQCDLDFLKEVVSKNHSVYISTCYEFYANPIPMSRLFKPSDRVEQAMRPVLSRFGAHTAGFHVRTTDNAQSLKQSPYRLFAEAARRELAENPQTTLFLATDSDEIRRKFLSEFGKSAICSDAELSRSSKHGMIAAATDLFLLSRCNKIYGSHYSSFSEIAAELDDKQAEILRLSN